MGNSIRRLANLSFVTFFAIALALAYWQFVAAGQVAARPDNPRQVEEELRTQRGWMYDRKGRPLVKNEPVSDGYVRRVYLYPSLAHVTGFSNLRFGPTGLEKALNDYLAGRVGQAPQDALQSQLLHRPRVGSDLVLTIDLDVQLAAERALGQDNGAVVALNPRSGEVLAMASRPTFDPNPLVFDPSAPRWSEENRRVEDTWNRLSADPASPLLNRAVQGLYSPGSTFKTVTLAAALEEGVAQPTTEFTFQMRPADSQHPVPWHANQYVTCQNHPDRDHLNLIGAYAWSCNVVFSELALKLGPDTYVDHARRFGVEEAPPLEIPTATSRVFTQPGYFSGQEKLYALASTGMGQGQLLATPLQMALIAAAPANGGEVPRPYLVSEIRHKDGSVVAHTSPQRWKQAMSSEVATTVRDMMVNGVDEGWARPAQIQGVKVAGKTGTAEHGTPGTPTHAWFIGFAPADNPQVAVAIVKESAGSGSLSATAAKGVIEAALRAR